MEQFLSGTNADELSEAALQNIKLNLTPYEDPVDLYSDYLGTLDYEKPLTCRVDQKRSDDSQKAFIVRCGSADISSVLLEPMEDSPGFGRHFWQVSEIQSAPITDSLSSVNITVKALKNQLVCLNGIQISEEDIAESDIPIPDLGDLESRFDPLPCFVNYQIGPLYGEVQVSDEAGNILSPLDHSDYELLKFQAAYPVHNIRIQAPEDLRIVVNGIELQLREASTLTSGVLKGLDPYLDQQPIKTATYHFEGLYSVPSVTAFDDSGTELPPTVSSDESYVFFHEGDAADAEDLQQIAERFFNAYMDYSAHAYDVTLFYNLLNQTLPGTELYDYFSTTRDTMIWAGSSTDERELHYSGFHNISKTCFVCTVTYSVDRTSSYWSSQEKTVQEGSYEIAFVSSSGRWYAAAMNIISV